MSYNCSICGKSRRVANHAKCSRKMQEIMSDENERRRAERFARWDQRRSTPIEHWKGK